MRCVVATGWVVLVFGLARLAGAQTAAEAPTRLEAAGREVTLVLPPGASRELEVELPRGSAAAFEVRQSAGAVEVTWRSGSTTSEPRTNPAGLGSRISVLLTATASGPVPQTPQVQTEQIAIRNLSKAKPAEIALHLDASHPITPDDRRRAEAETDFGHAEAIRAQRRTAEYADALRSYGEAADLWRSLNAPAQQERALVWKALFLFVNQSDAAAALPLSEQALKLRASLEPVEAANCLKISGYVNVQLGKYEAGLAAYKEAISIFSSTRDLYNQEVLLDNLSRVEKLLGDTDGALADAERADALARETGDATRQLKIKAEIGAIQLSAANLEAAYTSYQAALGLLKDHPDAFTEGYVWSDLGVLYTLLHQPAEAQAALEQATAVWARNPNPAGEINTLDDFGELRMGQGRLSEARAYYTRGLAIATSKSLPRDQVFLLRGLGATDLLQGDLARAAENLDAALALALKIDEGDSLSEIYCLTGDLHARRREFDQAEKSYQQCRSKADAAKDSSAAIRADGSLARLRFEQGDVDAAQEQIERAIAGIETARSLIPEQDLRTSFFASMRSYYDLAIAIFERLDETHPGEGYQWQAFLTAERARARMLLDIVHQREEKTPAASAALLAESAEVSERLRRQQLQAQDHGFRLSSAARQKLTSSIARLTVEDHALGAELAALHGGSETEPTGAAPLTLKSLQADLPPGRSVLLEYWAGDEVSVLWTITPMGMRAFPLRPARSLQPLADRYSEALRSQVEQSPTLSAERRAEAVPEKQRRAAVAADALRKALLPRGSVPEGTQSVLVVGDGPTLMVPFVALLHGDAPANVRELVMEPSASFLHYLLGRPVQPSRAPRIAVFAAGKSPAPTPGLEQPASFRPGSTAPAALPFVAGEAAAIRNVFGAQRTHILSAPESTPAGIQQFDWGSYAIGHFASHATLNRENLQLSGIVLNSEDGGRQRAAGKEEEVTLWYGDICRMQIPLELVVLSACDSANGENIPGEGLVGLSEAFFRAGSQRVLGSIWPADDEATSILMSHFYARLEANRSPAAALREAQRTVAAMERFRAPYYWAGFALSGDWRKLP